MGGCGGTDRKGEPPFGGGLAALPVGWRAEGPRCGLGVHLAAMREEVRQDCCCAMGARLFRAGQLASCCLVALVPPYGCVVAWVFWPPILALQYLLAVAFEGGPSVLESATAPLRNPSALFFCRRFSLLGLHSRQMDACMWFAWEMARTSACLYLLVLGWGGGVLSGGSVQRSYHLPLRLDNYGYPSGQTQADCDIAGVPHYVDCANLHIQSYQQCTRNAPLWYDCNAQAVLNANGALFSADQLTRAASLVKFAVLPGVVSAASLLWLLFAATVCLCPAQRREETLQRVAAREQALQASGARPDHVGCSVYSEAAVVLADIALHLGCVFQFAWTGNWAFAAVVALLVGLSLWVQSNKGPSGPLGLPRAAEESRSLGVYTDEFLMLCRAQRSTEAFPLLLTIIFGFHYVSQSWDAMETLAMSIASSFRAVLVLVWQDYDLAMGELYDAEDEGRDARPGW